VDEPDHADRLHPDLRWDYGCTLVGSLLVFGVPGLFALGTSGFLALQPRKTIEPLAAAGVSAFFGVVLLTMVLLLARSTRWYRRCSAVFYGRSSMPMRLHAVRNERGGLFLELHNLADVGLREAQVRIQAQVPAWEAGDLDGQIVKVRLDEDPKGPVVGEPAGGVLWPAPLSRRLNRIEGRLR